MADKSLRAWLELNFRGTGAQRAQSALSGVERSTKDLGFQQQVTAQKAQQLQRKMAELAQAVADGTKKFDEAEREYRDYERQLQAIGDTTEDTSRKTQGGLSAMTVALGNIAAQGFQMATQAAKEFVVDSLNVSSAAQETASLIENSLGPATEDFRRQMEELGDATGRSSTRLQEGASTIIAMVKNMGAAEDAAADMSVTFTQMALDLGSFFNRSTEEVFLDLQSALAGSAETMQKYGIDARETALQQEALRLGLIQGKETLDRYTRAQALQSIILTQASDAMGDAERTADSYENTNRRLGDAVYDLKVAVGDALTPTVGTFIGVLADGVRGMVDAQQEMERLKDTSLEAAAALKLAGDGSNELRFYARWLVQDMGILTQSEQGMAIQQGILNAEVEHATELIGLEGKALAEAAYQFYLQDERTQSLIDAYKAMGEHTRELESAQASLGREIAEDTNVLDKWLEVLKITEPTLLDIVEQAAQADQKFYNFNSRIEESTESTEEFQKELERLEAETRAYNISLQNMVVNGLGLLKDSVDGPIDSLDELEAALLRSALATNDNIEAIAQMGVIFGEWDEETAAEIIRQMELMAGIDILQGFIGTGTLGTGQLQEAVRILQEDGLTAMQDFLRDAQLSNQELGYIPRTLEEVTTGVRDVATDFDLMHQDQMIPISEEAENWPAFVKDFDRELDASRTGAVQDFHDAIDDLNTDVEINVGINWPFIPMWVRALLNDPTAFDIPGGPPTSSGPSTDSGTLPPPPENIPEEGFQHGVRGYRVPTGRAKRITVHPGEIVDVYNAGERMAMESATLGGLSWQGDMNIYAQPGQSAEEIADEVDRRLSRRIRYASASGAGRMGRR